MIETAPCVRCGTPTEFDPEVALKAFGDVVCCESCAIAETKARAKARQEKEIKERWEKLCPERFRDTLFERLPHHDKSQKAIEWQFPNGQGLNLWGFPDTGKTRTLYLILHRAIHSGKKAAVFPPGEFSMQLEKKAWNRADWIGALMRTDFLAFDDFDKMTLSKDHEAIFFSILDKRMASQLPCLFTHNSTANDLEYKFRFGKAMVRRIRQFTESIHFPSLQANML